MGVNVTRTKIIIPRRRPDLLSRSRLISGLDDVLDYPYTLISAPAGYGKTSLMIDLAHQANYPVCWYSIDPLDFDPNRFLTHFIHAIQIQFPEFGKAALSLLENQSNPLHDQAQIIRILVNEIYQHISEHFVIFLDDFHHLNSALEICTFISHFGQEMDDNTHLVLASRTLFNFPDLTLLIGRRLVKGIGFDELAFLGHEIKSYYKEILQREISDKETETLLERTEGWITGLVFSVDTNLAHLPGSGKKGRITGADLFQYLAEQVFEKQSPSIQDFLLSSSLFDEFNPDLCAQVLGEPGDKSWVGMISLLQQENLFVQQVEDENSWVRYHALFRDFLRARFYDRQPDEVLRIHKRLLEVYLASESWEKAFAVAKAINSPDLMAEVIDKSNPTLIHQGRMKLLSSWLDQLPEEGFDAFPKLLILRGISFTSLGNPLKGLSYINNILNKSELGENPEILTRALLCRVTTNRLLGRYDDTLSDINYIFKELSTKNINQTLLAETYREAALAHLNLSNYSNSKQFFYQSINSYTILGDNNNQALVHQDLGLLLMEHGFLRDASQHFSIALDTWITAKNINQQANIYNNMGTLSILTGNYTEAANLLRSAIECSNTSSSSRMLAFGIASQGDLAKSISLFRFSLEKYEIANAIAQQIQEVYLLSYIALNKSTVFRYLGKFQSSVLSHQVAQTFVSQASSRDGLGLWHIESGFQQLALGEIRSSRDAFLKAENIFINSNKSIELAKARLGLALSSHAMSKPRLTQQHMKDFSTSLVPLESNSPLLPELHYQGVKVKEALSNAPSNPALDTLLKDLADYQARLPQLQKEIFPDQNTDPLPSDTLEIFALGKNQVIKKSQLIDAPEWIYQKTVRELFFYLLTLPRGATKEQIGLIFWPDSSPAQLTCQFKNAIYRMRRSTGRDTILYDSETRTYSFNREQPYSYDVEDFLSILHKAEKSNHHKERIEYYQKAVDLYEHPYSPQSGGVWAEPIRQSLSRKYEQALLIIAENKLEQHQNQDCLDYCQKLLVIEPCQEEAFQISLRACANSNDRTQLIRVYKKCENNLSKYLNISPSKETSKLFEELLG